MLTAVDKPIYSKGDIPSLDGLRAISIVLVVAGHAATAPHSFIFRALFGHADLGVRVFFVISGFLITTLLLKERADCGSISLARFYIRRALRILPAFFLFIGCIALLSILGITPVPARSWVYVLTYTVNFAPFPPFSWVLIHLWSLSVEEQFYLLWPLVMKTFSPRTCWAAAIIAILAGPIAHAVQKLGNFTLPGYGPFPLVCGPIAMGCLLAMGARSVRSVIVSSKFLSDGRSLLFTSFLIALLDIIPDHIEALTVLSQVLESFLLTVCVARLVFIPTGLAGRALNSKPFVLIGKLSYSIYLWQQLFLYKLAGRGGLALMIALSSILAAASISYWGLEVRFLALRKQFRPRQLV